MMKNLIVVCLLAAALLLTGCSKANICPEGSVTYFDDASLLPPLADNISEGKTELQIGNKTIEFDRVIHGPICNDTWEGTVYVACDVQVAKWEDKPNFLDKCNLQIDPDAVVYVAAHNNAPYYKGCGECH